MSQPDFEALPPVMASNEELSKTEAHEFCPLEGNRALFRKPLNTLTNQTQLSLYILNLQVIIRKPYINLCE